MKSSVANLISTISQKWALAGMFTATVVLTVIIELLHRMPVVSPNPWWVWAMVAFNFVLISIAFAFIWLAAKNAIQHLIFSVAMLGILTSLLYFYSLVP